MAKKSKNKAYWLKELSDADVPSAPASDRSEFLSHPQVIHNEILVENNNPQIDASHQFGIPIKMSKTPGEIGKPIDIKSKDTWDILRSLKFTKGQLSEMAANKIIPTENAT